MLQFPGSNATIKLGGDLTFQQSAVLQSLQGGGSTQQGANPSAPPPFNPLSFNTNQSLNPLLQSGPPGQQMGVNLGKAFSSQTQVSPIPPTVSEGLLNYIADIHVALYGSILPFD